MLIALFGWYSLNVLDRRANLQRQQNVTLDHVAQILARFFECVALGEEPGRTWHRGNNHGLFVTGVLGARKRGLHVAREREQADLWSRRFRG